MLVRAVRAFFVLHLIIALGSLVVGGVLLVRGEVPGLPAAAAPPAGTRHQLLELG